MWISRSDGRVTAYPLTNEIYIRIVVVGRPVSLEVVKEARPVVRQAVRIEVLLWKRKGVVDPDKRWPVFTEPGG